VLDGEGGKDIKGNQDCKKPVWNRTRMIRPERGIEIVVGSLCCRWEKVKVDRGNARGRNRHAKLKYADLYRELTNSISEPSRCPFFKDKGRVGNRSETRASYWSKIGSVSCWLAPLVISATSFA